MFGPYHTLSELLLYWKQIQHTGETGLQRHKSLFPVIWGKLSAGLRLTRRSFLPLLIELSRALSYIILPALPNIIFTYGIMAHICRNNGADFRTVIATILRFPAPGFIILGTKLLLCSFNENSLWWNSSTLWLKNAVIYGLSWKWFWRSF